MSSQSLAVTAVLIMVIGTVGVGAGGFSGTAQAATLVVDDDGADCPGAGHATIQSAVNSASGGDTLQVCSGTYNEKVTIETTNLFIVANGSVVMDGETIESSAFVVNADGVVIDGFEMRNYTGSVVFTRADGGTISNNRIEFSMPGADTGTKGVYLYGNRDTIVLNNEIIDVPGGPSTRGPGILARGSPKFRGNQFLRDTVIVNNTITAKRNGIDFRTDGSGSVIRNNSIYVDKVTLDGHSGIRFFDVRNVVVRRNDISVRQTGEGRGITGNVRSEGNLLIDNNTVTGARYGIWVSGSSTPDKPVVVQSNNVSNSGNHGIRVKAVADTQVRNNSVRNPGGYGIVLVESARHAVTRNLVTETGDDGIRVIGVVGVDTSGNTIAEAGDHGLVIAESDDINVSNNQIDDQANAGMVLHRNGNELSAVSNHISGGTNGIRLRNAPRALLGENHIDGADVGLWFEPGNTLVNATGNVVTNATTGIRVQESGSPGLADSRLRDTVVSNTTSEVVRWEGTTPNTSVTDLTQDSVTVSFDAQNIRLSAFDSLITNPMGHQKVAAPVVATEFDGNPTPWLDITVSYTDYATSEVNESSIALWRYNGTAWSPVPVTTVDTATNEVHANITNFSVFAPLGVSTDTAAPRLVGSMPPDDASDIARDTDLTLKFNESVHPGTGRIYLNATDDDIVLHSTAIGSADVTIDGSNVSWNRRTDLPNGTDVYVYVPGGLLQDVSGNVWPGIQDGTTINFTTTGEADESSGPELVLETSLDPKATYLRTNDDDGSVDAPPLSLADVGVHPGDVVRLEVVGDFAFGETHADESDPTIAVFSGNDALGSSDNRHRIQEAIDAGLDVETPNTSRGDLETDIPEDFRVDPNVTLTVPSGATHLFVSTWDQRFGDNRDPDEDYGIRIFELHDTAAPEVSDLSIDVVDTRTISVSFHSNESLDIIEVEVVNQSRTVVETLTASDFESLGTDPVEYSAETTLASAGPYTVTLTAAADMARNDGASGENATVQLVVEDVTVTYVNGTAPDMANLTSNVYLTQGPGGLLQVQLRDASDPTADLVNRSDLENLGVEPDTVLAINVTLVDWTPRLLLGTGHDLSWTTTDVGANVTALNLTVQPAEAQLIESQLSNPDEPWPTGPSDRADIHMNATVDLAVDDMNQLAESGQRDLVDGTILATDAQAFGTPRYDAETNTLSVFVAGPHLTVDGQNHTGFYDAFLPDALLDDWGVEDASELTVAYRGDPIDFAAQNVDGGLGLAIDLTYSAGDVAISRTDPESGIEPEPEPEPAPPSASDPDPVSEPDDESEGTKTVEIDDTQDNVTVRKTVVAGNASANATVSLDVSVEPEDDPENATAEHPVTVDRLNVTMNRTSDVSLTITESAAPPTEDSATFERTDGTQLLGYIRIDHELDDADVSEVELEFRVRKALLDEAGDDPEHVALYRLEGDEWAELPTTLTGDTDTHYVFRAVSPGLSEFATGAKRAKFEIAHAQVSVTELRTGDDFEVLVRITNVGGADGTYTVELWIEADQIAEQTVTVAANGTRQVTFDHEFETPGSYEVRVNDRSTGQIHVLEMTPTPIEATPSAQAGTPDDPDTAPPEEPITIPLPGFGMDVALIALAMATLLAVWRRD